MITTTQGPTVPTFPTWWTRHALACTEPREPQGDDDDDGDDDGDGDGDDGDGDGDDDHPLDNMDRKYLS